jgi:hypothetical protein
MNRRWFTSNLWKALFSSFRWYRRWYGGVWELWHVDSPVNGQVWHELDGPTEGGPRPSPLCRGTPTVEDYRKKLACSKCGCEDLYTEVQCPGPSFRFRGAYLSGSVFCLCNRCGYSWGSKWPKPRVKR